jgi:hypothetical protein
VVPWHELEALIEPFYPKAGNGRMTLPSECVSLNRPVLGISIHPRRRRGGGNVGIGFIDFQGLWEGGKQHHRFPGFP